MDAVQISKRAEYALLKLVPISAEEKNVTMHHAAAYADDADDLRLLLAMLGIG